MTVNELDLSREVTLPPGLTAGEILNAVTYIERELIDLVDVHFDQVSGFSAVVGVVGTRALAALSTYEMCRSTDVAQQRFPDLRRRGAGPNPSPNQSLESKGSKRAWALQSHYDHPGWYIVWRYLVDPTESIEAGKPVIIWRVDVVFLAKEDWKYEGSSASGTGGGRTHTFGVKEAAKNLKGKAVYRRHDVTLRNGKPVPKNGNGS